MPRGENRPSVLLSREENDQVFSLIGPKCQSLATAVVQLFTTEGPAHSEWKKRDTGVLCLIKDNAKRSYFFRIYCLYRKILVWEHEVYLQIEYKSPRPFLHTFEAEEYMTAFNFANEEEAQILEAVLTEKINLRKAKREEKRQRSMLAARANISVVRQNGAPPPALPAPPTPAPFPAPVSAPVPAAAPALPAKTTLSVGSTYTLKGSKKGKRGKISKDDIGPPKDFKHISHVGLDVHNRYDIDKLPMEELGCFLSKAGVSATQLQDDDTREFIYDFIESHGGIDALKEELHDAGAGADGRPAAPLPAPTAAPPVPARSPAPPHPPAPPSRAPPPPPARAPSVSAAPPPRAPPPPRPAHPPTTGPPSVPPPPPPGAAPPPPAPPPPPPPAPPAAPPAPPDSVVPGDARAALMESIRSGGKSLKRVEPKVPQSDDSRSNLLSEIRQGIELKSVSRSPSSGSGRRGGGAGPGAGLAGALARALEERSRAIHSDSDSDDDDEDNDEDDWD